jgi:phage FluMu protein Com
MDHQKAKCPKCRNILDNLGDGTGWCKTCHNWFYLAEEAAPPKRESRKPARKSRRLANGT